ncbi:UNVERIFIED_CONTAM: hypothetical protein FKN15_038576 [Acipenser sinensis]
MTGNTVALAQALPRQVFLLHECTGSPLACPLSPHVPRHDPALLFTCPQVRLVPADPRFFLTSVTWQYQ